MQSMHRQLQVARAKKKTYASVPSSAASSRVPQDEYMPLNHETPHLCNSSVMNLAVDSTKLLGEQLLGLVN